MEPDDVTQRLQMNDRLGEELDSLAAQVLASIGQLQATLANIQNMQRENAAHRRKLEKHLGEQRGSAAS